MREEWARLTQEKDDIKKKLRQAKNKVDVLSAVCEILS